MERLILHPTDICQWYALVNEAQERSRLVLCDTTESYLVFLLMRFTNGAEWLDSILAMDFIESTQYPGQQLEKLKQLGDKSLLFSGLFPGIAEKRRVSLNYFVDMGQSAYYAVSQLEEDDNSGLYIRLSEQFPSLRKILQAMRF